MTPWPLRTKITRIFGVQLPSGAAFSPTRSAFQRIRSTMISAIAPGMPTMPGQIRDWIIASG